VRCLVPVHGAHPLALASIHGETLLRRAVHAAESAGLDAVVVAGDDVLADVIDLIGAYQRVVRPADVSIIVDEADSLLIHDPLCPLTPSAFLASMLAYRESGVVAVAALAVTDTIKSADGWVVTSTVDRAGLARIASPLVATGESVGLIGQDPSLVFDIPTLVRRLGDLGRVELVAAPSTAARVGEPSELDLLESVDEIRHLIRER
jgi:hypothetical protein